MTGVLSSTVYEPGLLQALRKTSRGEIVVDATGTLRHRTRTLPSVVSTALAVLRDAGLLAVHGGTAELTTRGAELLSAWTTHSRQPDEPSADLERFLALRRAERGCLELDRGSVVTDGGRPMPDYVARRVRELQTEHHVQWGIPVPGAQRRPVELTASGRALYERLARASRDAPGWAHILQVDAVLAGLRNL